MRANQEGLTRRSLLQSAGCVMAAAAIPVWDARAQQQASPAATRASAAGAAGPSVMGVLSDYMGAAGDRALPEDVIEKTKQHTLDTIAAMISGVNLPPARIAMKFAHTYGGAKTATVLGSDVLCGPIEAAMVNGMLAHSDETDDSNSPSQSHPGCGIVPAALAAAETFGISGTRFLRAVALGYDIGPRVSIALGGLRFQTVSHRDTHSIGNTFGASAAAGCAAGLSAQQMRWVLDYAAQQASGIAAWERDPQHIEKSFVFAGGPARNGVTAALLIQLGATGVDDIFSGADNFLIANSPGADPEKLIDQLGVRYEISRTNIKKWTVGSPIQAVLDALDLIIKQHSFTAEQVESVVVRVDTDEAQIVNNRELPDISMQHMVAVMLVDKTVTFRSAHDEARMKDPEVLRARAKVQLVPDAALDKLYPARVAIVEVTLKDGQHFVQRVDAVRGSAQNPMSHDEVAAKANDLIAPVFGEAQSKKLIAAVFALDQASDIRSLRPLLQHG